MKVTFPGPMVPMLDGGISFGARLGEQTIACWFSWELLQDVNPALTGATVMEQFNASKIKLLALAEQKILAGQIEDGIVKIGTGDLLAYKRPCGQLAGKTKHRRLSL